MTTTIMDLVYEALGNRTSGKFQITATPTQFIRMKEDLRQEWVNSGLLIGADSLPTREFSAISYRGILLHFIEGDHFSIQEIDIEYTPSTNGTQVYSSYPTA